MKNLYYHITNDSEVWEAVGDSEQMSEYLERKGLSIKNFDTQLYNDSEYIVYSYSNSQKKLFTIKTRDVDLAKAVHRYLRTYNADNYHSFYN